MSDDEPQARTSRPSLPPPGYFSCKQRIKILKRYQNLVRHRERWAPEMDFTTPIEHDIPDISSTTDQWHRHMLIDREISRTAVAVHDILNRVGIPTRISRRVREPIPSPEGQRQSREEHYDIIADYFQLQSNDTNRQETFELLMRMIEEGIGVYAMRQDRAFWELFNPLFWVAMLVRSPIWVLQRAGLAGDEQMRSLIVGVYGKSIYLLIILGLGFFVVRQGILTWKEVVAVILKHSTP